MTTVMCDRQNNNSTIINQLPFSAELTEEKSKSMPNLFPVKTDNPDVCLIRSKLFNTVIIWSNGTLRSLTTPPPPPPAY